MTRSVHSPLGLGLALVLGTGALVAFSPPLAASAAETTCAVEFTETTSDAGFTHPGVGLTAPILETVRDQVAAGTEPWASYYEAMTGSSAASRTITPANQNSADPTKPVGTAFDSQGVNSRFIRDALTAYTQTVLFTTTGDVAYRDNALKTIRLWSQMDPAQYALFPDAHIHTGIPLNRMVTAAEILRASACAGEASAWTEADTQAFSDNLVRPVMTTFQSSNDHFMNQHNYPLIGSIAGSIFLDDRDRYDEAVEWFTVNATANDQGFNGSIARLFRWVDTDDSTGLPADEPRVQHVEMGRDQAHGGGDITNATLIARMLIAQETRVDPVDGTVSEAADAVGPYEFLDDRVLAAADYFWRFMQGYDTPWTPVAYAISPDGTIRDTYNHISNSYRGRYNTASFWELHDYYTHVRGVDLAEVAPYFHEAYTKRLPSNFYYGGALSRAWDNVDGGGDFWLYTPIGEAGGSLPTPQPSATVLEIEDRYTALGGDVSATDDYVTVGDGSEISYLNGSTASKLVGLRVRTDAAVSLRVVSVGLDRSVLVPDTRGEWRTVTIALAPSESIGDLLRLTASGAAIDVDHLASDAATLTAPFFAGGERQRVVGLAGSPLALDLSAEADGLQYSAAGLPDGAALDAATGVLEWHPSAAASAAAQVFATDGTTSAARAVSIEIGADRTAALAAARSGFDAAAIYESASRATFDEALATATDAGDDASFVEALPALVAATDGLRLVSPPSPVNGTLDYPGLVASSTMGTSVFSMVDGDNQTFVSYGLAQNLSHTLDFGPDFRVSAESFSLQSNIFSDRLSNSAVFGSNDGSEWTRLTPGLTTMTQALQTLEVDPSLQAEQFRFIRVQLLEPQPDVLYGTVRNLFEMSEFHIDGERHEIGNQLASVSIASREAVAGKIMLGGPVDVTVVARDVVDSVAVTIGGVSVAATSDDGIAWTASGTATTAGTVSLAVDYVADGVAGPTSYATTDGSTLFAAGAAGSRIDVAGLASVVASHPQWPGNALPATQVGGLLFDGDAATYGDLTQGTGSFYTIDLGEGAALRLDEAYVLPRASHPARTNGTVVQGSTDGSTWTDLAAPVAGARAGAWSTVTPAQGGEHYRYIRLTNATAWSGNLAEVEFYGDLLVDDGYLDTVVRDTAGSTRGSARVYAEEVERIRAAFAAEGANRTALLGELLAAGRALVSERSLFPLVEIERSGVVASSGANGGGANAADNGWRAFDGDAATATDTTAAAGWVRVDLGADGVVNPGAVRLLPRVAHAHRMNGGLIQASSDGSTWTTLVELAGIGGVSWHEFELTATDEYRYLRFSSPRGYANVAELQFFERVVDRSLLELLTSRGEAMTADDWSEASFADLEAALAAGAEAVDADQAGVDAAAAAIDAALTGLAPRHAEWSATAVYSTGDRVRSGGAVFEAQWWTQAQTPGAAAYGPWAEVGAVVTCDSGAARAWTESWIYTGGETVVHDGSRWSALWWTRNQTPDAAAWGPWVKLGAC